MNPAPTRWQRCRADVLLLLLLLLASVKYTFGIERVLDVQLYDESNYLQAGATLLQNGLPPPQSAPLYALWYWLLSLAQPDRVSLYYLNLALTTALPPLFLFVLLRASRVPRAVSAAVAAYFLITQVVTETWPRPSHFALLIVLASLAAATRLRRASSATLLVAVGALLAAYARPEYLLAFLLLLTAGAVLLAAEPGKPAVPRRWLPLGATLLLAALLLGGVGWPAFGQGGGERHFYAFAQHFAMNWGAWNHVDSDGPLNVMTNYREIAARSFGSAETVSAAARHNPAMFAKHILTNLKNLAAHFPGLLLHHENLFLSPGVRAANLEARLTLLGLLGWLYATRRAWWDSWGASVRLHRRYLLCAAALCLPGAISSVEITPHNHYLLLPGTLLLAAAAMLFAPAGAAAPRLPATGVLLLALGSLAAVPALSHRPAVPTPIVRTIREIQGLGLKVPVQALDAEGGYDCYLPANYHRVAEYDKRLPFNQFLADSRISLVVLTAWLNKDSRFQGDPEWAAFRDHPAEAGFTAHRVPGTDVTLLIRRDLLPPDPQP